MILVFIVSLLLVVGLTSDILTTIYGLSIGFNESNTFVAQHWPNIIIANYLVVTISIICLVLVEKITSEKPFRYSQVVSRAILVVIAFTGIYRLGASVCNLLLFLFGGSR